MTWLITRMVLTCNELIKISPSTMHCQLKCLLQVSYVYILCVWTLPSEDLHIPTRELIAHTCSVWDSCIGWLTWGSSPSSWRIDLQWRLPSTWLLFYYNSWSAAFHLDRPRPRQIKLTSLAIPLCTDMVVSCHPFWRRWQHRDFHGKTRPQEWDLIRDMFDTWKDCTGCLRDMRGVWKGTTTSTTQFDL